jgi:hypothetical protein
MDGGGEIPSGTQYQARAQYRCVNTSSGRASDWGPIGTGPMLTVP